MQNLKYEYGFYNLEPEPEKWELGEERRDWNPRSGV